MTVTVRSQDLRGKPVAEARGIKAFFKRFGALRRGLRRRQAFAELARLEPWQLEDIGLTPDDIHYGRRLPLSDDALSFAKLRARRRGGVAFAQSAPIATAASMRNDTVLTHLTAPWSHHLRVVGPFDRPRVM